MLNPLLFFLALQFPPQFVHSRFSTVCSHQRAQDLQEKAFNFTQNYTEEAEKVLYDAAIASWNYNTNITDYNQQLMVSNQIRNSKVFCLFT